MDKSITPISVEITDLSKSIRDRVENAVRVVIIQGGRAELQIRGHVPFVPGGKRRNVYANTGLNVEQIDALIDMLRAAKSHLAS